MKKLISLMLLMCFSMPVIAAIEAYEFKNDEAEAEYKALIDELRCLVCQNQNLADSDADLAKDLRKQTYEMVQQGKNRQEVIEYMVNRYGDFVLYKPPVKSSTLLLWAGPFVLLLIVLLVVVIRVKKTRAVDAPQQENLQQAKGLLSDEADNRGGSK